MKFTLLPGRSQLSLPNYEYARPPRETTLLDMTDVLRIESEDGLTFVSPQNPGAGMEAVVPNTSRQEARKRETQAIYQAWQEEYVRLMDSKPGMSKKWYSKKIAKMDVGQGRDSETIRKRLDSRRR